MRIRKPGTRRSGAALVEAAIVVPVLLLLLLGIFSGAIMVITADEVSNVSREGARYASVRGTSYAFNTKRPAATAAEISDYVKQQGVMLDSSRMTVNVSWSTSNRPNDYVIVEVRYQWPGLGPFGAQEFVSRSEMLITY